MKPFSGYYFPLMYTEKVKRPGARYLVRGILLGDALAVFLAYGWFMQKPGLGALGIVFLQLSIWTIYEMGYFENDKAAATFEKDGHLPENFADYIHRMSERWAWLYAVVFSFVGIYLVSSANGPTHAEGEQSDSPLALMAKPLTLWIGFLLLGRSVYYVYNRISGRARLLLYPVLQLFRFGGYSLISVTNIVGALLISAFVLGRWVPYVIWRVAKVRWHERNKLLVLAWFVLTLPLGYSVEPEAYWSLHVVVVFGWLIARSAREIVKEVKLFERLSTAAV